MGIAVHEIGCQSILVSNSMNRTKENQMDNRVYVAPCSDYSQAGSVIDELLEMMGGMNRFVQTGETLILKPNLLMAASPDRAVSTHPDIVAAVARQVKSSGGNAIIADSPGSGYAYTGPTLKRLYKKCGMIEAAETAGIDINLDTSYQNKRFSEGRLIKRFEIISPVLDADGVLNLCKLKTHTFMVMTGAVKNNFGVIPGWTKPGYHAKLRDTQRFAGMLLDLMDAVTPRLSIMDAIVGMEGNGPAAGNPKNVGLLLGSTHPLALDVVASEIMGLPCHENPILIEAAKRRLTPACIDDVDLIGITKKELRQIDFKLPDTLVHGSGFERLPSWLLGPVESLFRRGSALEPRVYQNRCTACGVCRDGCPVRAIDIMDSAYATISYKKCIRCYCCHELCPESAIGLRRSLIYRLFHSF